MSPSKTVALDFVDYVLKADLSFDALSHRPFEGRGQGEGSARSHASAKNPLTSILSPS
jgi:hypothetical protein